MYRGNKTRGFTLVEVLLVVIILGILASLVMAQFFGVREDARKAALSDQLHTLRVQLLLYSVQHGDEYADLTGGDWSTLTTQTTYSGRDCGPYLPSVPRNTLNDFTGVAVVMADPAFGDAVAGPSVGFVYNINNGVIWATNTAGDKVYNEANPDDPAN